MDKNEAIRATKHGAIAACISGALTTLITLVAVLTQASDDLAVFSDPLMFVDVVLIFVLAFAIFKKSRLAAILMFTYFIISKVVIGFETGRTSGLLVGLVFLYFYGRAIQGAFVYHRLEREENPDRKKTSKWAYWVGIPIALPILALIFVGLLSVIGFLPGTRVLETHQVFEKDSKALVEHGVLNPSDKIDYFYSWGLTSVLEGGTVLTGDRIVMYIPGDAEELEVYEILYSDIANIEMIEKGDAFTDSVYLISSSRPDDWISIPLSTENAGDTKFINFLKQKTANTQVEK